MTKRRSETAIEYPNIERDLWPLAIPLEGLQLDPFQARKHDERSLEELVNCLRKDRQKKNIVVQRQGMIVKAGNGTVMAARKLGWTHIAAVVSDDADKLIREYAIRDNRSAELSTWNPEAVALEIERLEIAPVDVGWSKVEFTEFTSGLKVDLAASSRNDGQPPGDFPEVDENIPTDYCCPKCGYKWSGKTSPGVVVEGDNDFE